MRRQFQSLLDEASGRGEWVVWRLGAEQKKVDRLGIDILIGQELFGSLHSKVRRALLVLGDESLIDPCFLIDQGQIPVWELSLQIFVGFRSFWEDNGDRANRCVLHKLPFVQPTGRILTRRCPRSTCLGLVP